MLTALWRNLQSRPISSSCAMAKSGTSTPDYCLGGITRQEHYRRVCRRPASGLRKPLLPVSTVYSGGNEAFYHRKRLRASTPVPGTWTGGRSNNVRGPVKQVVSGALQGPACRKSPGTSISWNLYRRHCHVVWPANMSTDDDCRCFGARRPIVRRWTSRFYAAWLVRAGQTIPIAGREISGEPSPMDARRVSERLLGWPRRMARRCKYQKQMTHHMMPDFPLDWAAQMRPCLS